MGHLKVIAAIVSIATVGLAYILLTRYFPQEGVWFWEFRPLTRVLAIDMKVKSDKAFPTFLPKNLGFLVLRPNTLSEDHRKDRLETRYILQRVAETNKNTIDKHDTLYSSLEILFLRKNVSEIDSDYMTLASLHIKAIFFNPDYLLHFSSLYSDVLPHAAGYVIMNDGSQRLIRDILVH